MSNPLEVCCCAAPQDKEMLTVLTKYLAPLQRIGKITIWDENHFNAPSAWETELHQHLESADVFLLLISPDFVASDSCYNVQMKRALERYKQGSAIVIPLLLRPTFWQHLPFASLQMLPTGARPISKWADQDDVFLAIVRQIDQVISRR